MSADDQRPIGTKDDAPHPAPDFAPTRWTLVLRSRGETPEARTALSELCEIYYEPVLRFLRREGRDDAAARELAHGFFARVLAGAGFAGATEERGRFRSYLLGSLKHFLADQRDSARRLKRGGGIAPISLDESSAEGEESELQLADPQAKSPDEEFDREWALVVMRRGLESLELDMAAKGKQQQFTHLKPWLVGDAPHLSQVEVSTALGMTESAVKVAVHRLRRRFGELVRREIAQTLCNPAQADEELAHLVRALS